MVMDLLMSKTLWIGMTVTFGLLFLGMVIFYYFLFKKTHLMTEIKAFFSDTPIGIFFQDNKFAEFKPITPINGIVYDQYYGPFVVSTTYVDKKTKKIIIPFDVDLDGDRTSNMKELVTEFQNVTNNQKSIADLRTAISTKSIDNTNKNVQNMTSHIKYSNLKQLFYSMVPHNIKSRIEQLVSNKIKSMGSVNHMQAIMIFGAIFGIIVIAALILKTTGGV